MAPILHMRVGGVEGLVRDVPFTDVLAALREQMFDLEADVLLRAKAEKRSPRQRPKEPPTARWPGR